MGRSVVKAIFSWPWWFLWGYGAIFGYGCWRLQFLWLPCLVLLLSVFLFLLYALDKWASQHGRRRIPEKYLQLLAFIGGWPGALIAQEWLRHKSSKQPFRRIFWGMVILLERGCTALFVKIDCQVVIWRQPRYMECPNFLKGIDCSWRWQFINFLKSALAVTETPNLLPMNAGFC